MSINVVECFDTLQRHCMGTTIKAKAKNRNIGVHQGSAMRMESSSRNQIHTDMIVRADMT